MIFQQLFVYSQYVIYCTKISLNDVKSSLNEDSSISTRPILEKRKF